MRVLLDTSYLYDVMEEPGKFLEPERLFLSAREVRIYVSAVSIWEMRLKHNAHHLSGARKSRFAPNDVIVALADQDVTFLPMTIIHAARALSHRSITRTRLTNCCSCKLRRRVLNCSPPTGVSPAIRLLSPRVGSVRAILTDACQGWSRPG